MAEIAVQAALQIVMPFITGQVSHFISKQVNKSNLQSDITSAENSLKTMKAFLEANHGAEGDQLFQNTVRQIRDLAYKIEDGLEEYKFHVPDHFHRNQFSETLHNLGNKLKPHGSAFNKLSSKMKAVMKEVNEFLKLLKNLQGQNSGTSSIPGPSSSPDMKMEDYSTYYRRLREREEIVGFQRVREDIIKQLLSNDPRRLTVSIVGPSGSGKTFLARDVFEDQIVKKKFNYRDWLTLSPSFDEIKSMVVQFSRDLEDKRYIVVLDNIWSDREWKLIDNTLPRGRQGSRIIVTSCNNGVATSSCSGDWGHVHELQGLPFTESWNLFCRNAFGSETGECLKELEVSAQKLVKKCEGLPGALRTVARSVSEKAQESPSEWKEFHNTLGQNLPLMRSLWPSFGDLRVRSDLKSCFFYFSVFPEDTSVPRQELIRLWIAEGFLGEHGGERMAEEYLKELVRLNLVHVSKWDVDGRRVNSCRVLNLVRDFIISQAEEEKFVGVISTTSSSAREGVRRLSLIADKTDYRPAGKLDHVRSVFLFGKNSSFNLDAFKLVKVLSMNGAALRSFPEQILRLRILKYLSLQRTKIKSIPSSIKKLSLLETLDLKQTLITELPTSICLLQNLQYLLVYGTEPGNSMPFGGAQGFGIHDGLSASTYSDGLGALSHLRKLSLIRVNENILKELSKLVNLRKLGIVGLEHKYGKKFCESLRSMGHLSTLDVAADKEDSFLDLDYIDPNDYPGREDLHRLHLKGKLDKLPRWVSVLTSVIKISLKWSSLGDSPVKDLQDLPNLMELELVEAYTGHSLVIMANTFTKLKVLNIERLAKLKKVEVQRGAMPRLERLKICNCESMRTSPLGIGSLSCLKELDVSGMHENFNNAILQERYTNIGSISIEGRISLYR